MIFDIGAPQIGLSRRQDPAGGSIRNSASIRWQTALDPSRECRIVALVDFIAIDLNLKTPTHPDAVIRLSPPGTSYRRIKKLSGHVAKTFSLVLQDPTPKIYRETLKTINERYPFEKEPTISELEISMDFYPADRSIEALGELAARLFHFAKNKPINAQRIVRAHGKPFNVQEFGALNEVIADLPPRIAPGGS